MATVSQTITSIINDMEKLESHTLLLGMQNGAGSLETVWKSLKILKKKKSDHVIQQFHTMCNQEN